MKTFLTRVDLSDDRQIKQYENKLTTLSGSTNILQYAIIGQDYDDLKKGVDTSTSCAITTYSDFYFTFTGTTGSTTYFGIPPIYASLSTNLPIITNLNYSGTDFLGESYDSIQTVIVDGNSFDILFSGVQISFNVIPATFAYLGSPSGNTFSGMCFTNWVHGLSARTYDWYYLKSGSTTWLNVLGRTHTQRLSVESNLVPTTSGSTGITGTITWDSDYLYVCVATNTWKRTPLSPW